MAISQAFTNSAKLEFLQGIHLAADVYKIALFSALATLSKSTTVYNAANEVPESGDYAAGGQVLDGYAAALYGDVATIDWTTDPTWNGATIAAAGALIYNSSRGNKAIAVLDFGGVITSTNGEFKVTLPPAAAGTALIRIA